MARRFANVSEEEIEEAFSHPSDLVNTKTTIPLSVGEERFASRYISTIPSGIAVYNEQVPIKMNQCWKWAII